MRDPSAWRLESYRDGDGQVVWHAVDVTGPAFDDAGVGSASTRVYVGESRVEAERHYQRFLMGPRNVW